MPNNWLISQKVIKRMKFSDIPYKRPSIDLFKSNFEVVLNQFQNAESFEQHDRSLLEMQDLLDQIYSKEQLCGIRFDNNTTDTALEKEVAFVRSIMPQVRSLNNKLYTALSESNYREELANKWGQHILTIADFESTSFAPNIMGDLEEEGKLKGQYNKLVGGAQIDFEGKTVTLPGLGKYRSHRDRNLRKKSFLAQWKFFEKHQEEFDDIYDQLIRVRHSMAQKLGYKNYVELSYRWMRRFDYDAKMVKNFRNQIANDVVPLDLACKERQARRLGLEKLEAYDVGIHFNSGNPQPKGTPEEILLKARKMYRELSEETAVFFDMLLDHDLIDVVNRPGKSARAYCWHISDLKYPYIFANFNGTLRDIGVLTHEAGHGFQYFESRNFPLRNYREPQAETAEIHSMAMEYLTYPWMKDFFQEDTEKYFFVHLNRSIVSLGLTCAIDHFQEIVYSNPGFSADERSAAYLEVQDRYTPFRKSNLTPYLASGRQWQVIPHLYSAPFYSIDYALAQICALQFWKKSEDNREEAWSDYLKLCQAGGSASFLSLLKMVNLRSPFEEGTVKYAVDLVLAKLDSIDDSVF